MSTPKVLTTELRDLIYNQCIDNACCYLFFIYPTGRIRVCKIRFFSTDENHEKPCMQETALLIITENYNMMMIYVALDFYGYFSNIKPMESDNERLFAMKLSRIHPAGTMKKHDWSQTTGQFERNGTLAGPTKLLPIFSWRTYRQCNIQSLRGRSHFSECYYSLYFCPSLVSDRCVWILKLKPLFMKRKVMFII